MQQAARSIRALVTRGKKTPAAVETLSTSDLPTNCVYKGQEGPTDCLVDVEYSCINYKDALVVSGNYAGLKTPMVGGIDFAGTITECKSDRFKVRWGFQSRGSQPRSCVLFLLAAR